MGTAVLEGLAGGIGREQTGEAEIKRNRISAISTEAGRLTNEGRYWPDLAAAFLLFDGHGVLQRGRRMMGPGGKSQETHLGPPIPHEVFSLESILPPRPQAVEAMGRGKRLGGIGVRG